MIKEAPIVFLCVKPNVLNDVAESIAESFHEDDEDFTDYKWPSTLVSILAGTSINSVRKELPMFASFVRAMPNTPLQVQAGCTAITQLVGRRNTDTVVNHDIIKTIFSSLGIVEVIDESKFHAITALSGNL